MDGKSVPIHVGKCLHLKKCKEENNKLWISVLKLICSRNLQKISSTIPITSLLCTQKVQNMEKIVLLPSLLCTQKVQNMKKKLSSSLHFYAHKKCKT